MSMNDKLRIVDIKEFVRIETPAEWRALLMQTAVGVLDQRVNVSQANAVVGLSTEVHKSIRQEFEMRCFAADSIDIKDGKVVRLLEGA
jgi:CYTH domain-containing protein